MCRGEQKVKNRNFANDLIPGPHPQQVDHLNKRGILTDPVRPKNNICVFTVTCQKNLGSVGRDFFNFFFYYRQNRK